jgi:predicted dehydrogenase
MRKTINLGIIGCGQVLSGMHLPALIKLKDRFKISALCDTNPKTLKRIQEIFSLKYNDIFSGCIYSNNAFDILKDKRTDAAAILTPTSSHLGYTIEALKNNKYVFLEKPSSVLPSDVKKIISSEKKYNKFVQIGMVLRYSGFFKTLDKLINSKKYGKLLWMNWLETRPFDPMIWRYANPEKEGDAIIHDKAIHQINLFNHFAGSKADSVYAIGGQYLLNKTQYKKLRAFKNEVLLKGSSNDNLMAIIKYKNGVKASITISYVSPHARESRFVIQLERAKIIAHFETFVYANSKSKRKWKGNPTSIYVFADNNKLPIVWKYPMSYPPSEKHLYYYDEYPDEPMHPGSVKQWEAFYNNINNNIKPETNTKIALEDTIIADSMVKSIKKKSLIKIK